MSNLKVTRLLAIALNYELDRYNPDESSPFIVPLSETTEARWNGGAWSFWAI
jgi:hypothetical protein